MKKTELPGCPKWLLDAETENENVEWGNGQESWINWIGGEFLGGQFRGGQFRGGQFRGGEFRGGEFLGGYFLGGQFRGGEFRGGEFLGGQFLGGEFLGGEFRGGEFLGGQFRGGEFLGGEFLGGNTCARSPWSIRLDAKDKTIIHIGCKVDKIKNWNKFFKAKMQTSHTGTDITEQQYRLVRASYLAMLVWIKETQ